MEIKKRLKTILLGVGLLLAGQNVLAADSQCPNGQFNPNQSVCMCPGGGYVGPGEWCRNGNSKVLPLENAWGAIAIDLSSAQKQASYRSSRKNQADANKKALEACGLSTCRVVLSFRNSCGAITGNGKGIWGGGIDIDESKALQKAADACYAKGAKDCYKWLEPSCANAPR
ncbi:MAG: DUF4189 domain-containing protein [Limnobaculum xujianqingii]